MLVPDAAYPLDLSAIPGSWIAGWVGDFMADIQPGFASGVHNQISLGIPHLRPMNVDREGRLSFDVVKYVAAETSRSRVEVGDVLFNNTNSPALVGKTTAINAPGDLSFSNHMTRLRPAGGLSHKFVAYQLHFLWMTGYFAHRCTNHVNQASISSTTLGESVPLVVPPLAEQHRIVAEIEKHLSRLDAAIAALERARANLKRYRASVLKAAVEGRLTGSASYAQWIPMVFGDLLTYLRNGISKKPDADSGLPILRISAVRPLALNAHDVRFLKATPNDYTEYLIEPGDLLFTRYNGNPDLVGVCAAVRSVEEPTVHPDKLICARVRQTLAIPRYLEITLNVGASREFLARRVRTTAGQSGVSGGDLRQVPVVLPSVAEQERIVEEVDRRLSVVENLEAAIENTLRRADRLRQSVLKCAFEGRLVPQDPNDEPASVLLERIRAERAGRPAAASRMRRQRSTQLPLVEATGP